MNNTKDLEYHLEKCFVTGLRACFMEDDKFPYAQKHADTQVIITSAYPQKDADFKVPQIVIADIGFSLSETSLYNNFESDIMEENSEGRLVKVGERFATVVPYNISIMCFANESGIAKDLANRVVNIIGFEAKDLFNDYYNLNIKNVSRSGSGIYSIQPTETFNAGTSLNGYVNWVGVKKPKLPQYVRNIDLLLKTSINKEDYEEPFDIDDYEKIHSITLGTKE